MVRTQLYLDEPLHERLRDLAEQQGRSISDLVREALSRVYGRGGAERKLRTLRAIEGLWQDRADLEPTDAYVRGLRHDTRPSRPRDR